MGWTYHKKPENVKDWLKDTFTGTSKTQTFECIDVSYQPSKKEAYLAVEVTDKATGNKSVTAVVVIFDFKKKDPRYGFGYKIMDEDVGPYYWNCPKKILKRLTPTAYEYAIKWRAKCWENFK